MTRNADGPWPAVRIPANIDREDRVLLNLTARQLLVLVITGLILYGSWSLSRPLITPVAWLVLAAPVAILGTLVALGQRDGLPLDRYLLAAVRWRLQPRVLVTAPEGVSAAPQWLTSRAKPPAQPRRSSREAPSPLRMPAGDVGETGVIDLGADGVAAIAVCSTVNFALRTPEEQESLVVSFGRYLHSLTTPAQILVRAERLDLSSQIAELREDASRLPHPALEDAAHAHADFLAELARDHELLRHQVLLILREPLRPSGPTDGLGRTPARLSWPRRHRTTRHTTRGRQQSDGLQRAAEARLRRRLVEARDLLQPAGITVSPLDAGHATAILASACNPGSFLPPSGALAPAGDVISGTLPDEPHGNKPLRDETWDEDASGIWTTD
ncbi:PrgI family protein [Streptodolium elevatio]|uniref:PrgI family protein n=1 Tax=Streptodolium elevatio TaxID=3157996 RepID=A0ABV3D9L7_9ACTN